MIFSSGNSPPPPNHFLVQLKADILTCIISTLLPVYTGKAKENNACVSPKILKKAG